MSAPLAGAEMMTFLAPAVRCLRGLVAVREEPAALEDDVDAEALPGQLPGSRSASTLSSLPPTLSVPWPCVTVVLELAVHGVVLQEVRERLGVGDVVHRDDVEPALTEAGAEHVPSDAAEAVDTDAHSHGVFLLERSRG